MRFHKSFLAGEPSVSCFARLPKRREDSTFVIKYRFYIAEREAVYFLLTPEHFHLFIYGAIYCCIVSGGEKALANRASH
jgi:hypothetical protein